MEKIAQFPGGEKSIESCRVSGCHGLFGPKNGLSTSFFLSVNVVLLVGKRHVSLLSSEFRSRLDEARIQYTTRSFPTNGTEQFSGTSNMFLKY